ncbi:META domain-containing protein [Vibrio aestuarianus]|uniref:META domain-containing protein n=1 Tax=Vibrio aestuarianus TaxID=28171 RepID=A0A9X4EY52_9VIBR|nr:META domain-containing protein [Vibrio aestuarianus]MDE1224157.1 META domain-containing protein [Vibrio aestuarianus]MDE1231762.1 META domain-containing protein [Vibrio aestuarianus]MDE1327409.1 META domain-containing protein [Vibrio aestuarianus]MDE1335673.1 META domain-containing protein [Vibrio aestuarianus]MDE1337981.1 META domain-containing protein [Vibrio aestuarianus]
MKLSSKKLLAAISLPVLMTACASSGDNVKQITAQDLQHHNWQLVQIDGKEVTNADKQKAPRLEIGEKMMASGNAGCNNFFGQAELKDNQFRIEKMGMTMMMCVGDVMDTEQAFSQTLSDWSDITVTKDGLTLKNDVHTLTFTLRDWVN